MMISQTRIAAPVTVSTTRVHGARIPYLLTAYVYPEFGRVGGGDPLASYPSAQGVVNDFGDVVIVTRWS